MIAWADRPQPMNEGEFKKEKDRLAKQVDYLLKAGRRLYDDRLALDAKPVSGLTQRYSKMKENRANQKSQQEFECNCILIENDFRKLNMIAQYRNKVEPLKYSCNFILGCISAVVFLIFFIHMWVAGTLRSNNRQ
jgi:hypothetical protein